MSSLSFLLTAVGLAIFHRRFMDAYFISSFYKMILRKEPELADLESVDSEMYNSLNWML